MKNEKYVDRLMDALEDMLHNCDVIKDNGGCGKCPMKIYCIEDEVTFEQIACDASKRTLLEFYDFADDMENRVSEEDYIADLADRERKGERDELYD